MKLTNRHRFHECFYYSIIRNKFLAQVINIIEVAELNVCETENIIKNDSVNDY